MNNEHSWEDEVRQAESAAQEAFLAQDTDRLRQLFADELVVNSPIHRIHTREQVLDLLERGIIRHESLEQRIEVITRHGDVVIVMGSDEVRDKAEGPLISRRFTNMWSNADGSWKLIARQATPIASR